MATVTVNFERCIQDSQEYGSSNDMMVSRVFFSIEVKKQDGTKAQIFDRLHANLKQAVGGSFDKTPIEVGFPHDHSGNRYAGPISYQKFRNAAESYYRSLVGSTGTGIHIEGSSNIRMQNNLFEKRYSVTFESD